MPSNVKADQFTIGVGAAVVRDDRLLMVKHNYGPMKWQIPGGFVQLDETVEQAAVREVLEETAITAVPEGIFAVRHRINKKGNNLYAVFKCHTDDTHDPVPDGYEVSHARFMTLEEIETLAETWVVNVFLAHTVLAGDPPLLSLKGDPEGLDRIYKLFA